jgi:hypothetical protein
MAQQSTTNPRPARKTQGKLTRDQNKRIVNRQENTKGSDVELPGETLKHANLRYPKPGPGSAYEISTGDRSIQRGAHDETDHHKTRSGKD